MRDLSGKRVLITGAGEGLGRDLSIEFATHGAEVMVTDIDEPKVAETVRLIMTAEGSAVGFTMDVTSESDVRCVCRELHSRQQPLDILINNAGIVRGGPFLDVGLDEHRAVMKVNALGPMIVTHEFLPDLLARREAHLVMIASASGILPTPLQLSYTASKWASLGFADALRQELRLCGQKHVRVTSVCSSYLDTGMFRGVRLPRLTRAVPTAELAAKIVRAVRCNKNYVMAPWTVRLAPLGKALLPLSIGERLLDWMEITDGMREWVGHGQQVQSTPCSSCGSPVPQATRTRRVSADDHRQIGRHRVTSRPRRG